MLRWESYRAVYGAELRAAAREYSDHGWPVVGACSAGLLLATGTALDVIEVPAAVGRRVCALLREAGMAVPVAATPTGSWWFPVTPGGDAARVAARAGRRRPAHRRRRRPRPAVGDPRRLGALAGRPRPLRLPSVTGGPDRRGGAAAVEMHESDRLPAVAGRP